MTGLYFIWGVFSEINSGPPIKIEILLPPHLLPSYAALVLFTVSVALACVIPLNKSA